MLHPHHLPPAPAPHLSRSRSWPPSPSPSATTPLSTDPPPSFTSLPDSSSTPPSKLPVDFSPPLIAMVVIIATAFVIITYSRLLSRHFIHIYRRYRRWRRRRRRYVPSSSASDIESPPYSFDPTDAFHVLSPYGLDESIIKTIPLSVYTRKSGFHDCAVCLLEFEDNDYVRTLPVCSHAFHVDCIDIWLRSHANCPLCRAGIFRQDSPFTPLMAARIRPSLDDMIIESTILEPLSELPMESEPITEGEITQEASPRRSNIQSEDRVNRRDFLLKRSYSFGFERNLGSERLVLEPVTASPWRYRRGGGGGSFWSKRPSPFSSLTKTQGFLISLLQRHEIPILATAEHRWVLPVIGVEHASGLIQRGQLVEEDEVVREPNVHEVVGSGSSWGGVLVQPAKKRRSRGTTVTGEIQQRVRMKDTWMDEN
ncbi:UNVERIFIED_CONTAM: RING-H2 finger protein ATL65 [Sesamum radiatum]|uniref:RING-type E3 ubiquitin transferase n=1 Tax=Sesamum radiatum TaxID=300843 RepID=A0AAW2MVF1_SESRA